MTAPLTKGPIKVGLISLGCAKNLVDSEIMIGHLQKAGMAMTPDAAEADVIVVNTCSFIDAAKEERLGAILEANRARGMRKKNEASTRSPRSRPSSSDFRATTGEKTTCRKTSSPTGPPSFPITTHRAFA
jgi:hypothetical protein